MVSTRRASKPKGFYNVVKLQNAEEGKRTTGTKKSSTNDTGKYKSKGKAKAKANTAKTKDAAKGGSKVNA